MSSENIETIPGESKVQATTNVSDNPPNVLKTEKEETESIREKLENLKITVNDKKSPDRSKSFTPSPTESKQATGARPKIYLYLRNLPESATERDILDYFPVEITRSSEKKSGRRRSIILTAVKVANTGWILKFRNEENCEKALKHSRETVFQGRPIVAKAIGDFYFPPPDTEGELSTSRTNQAGQRFDYSQGGGSMQSPTSPYEGHTPTFGLSPTLCSMTNEEFLQTIKVPEGVFGDCTSQMMPSHCIPVSPMMRILNNSPNGPNLSGSYPSSRIYEFSSSHSNQSTQNQYREMLRTKQGLDQSSFQSQSPRASKVKALSKRQVAAAIAKMKSVDVQMPNNFRFSSGVLKPFAVETPCKTIRYGEPISLNNPNIEMNH